MIFVNKFCFMDKAVSRICPLDLMMKYVQFQVKKRLSHEVSKVTVELSSAVGLSAHPPLSAASACLARQKNLAGHQYQGRALSARSVR